jgi:hypothetical protein
MISSPLLFIEGIYTFIWMIVLTAVGHKRSAEFYLFEMYM